MLRLGVLDQSPVRGGGPADAIHETLELAEICDRLGYYRYWLAEHHATPGLAGSSPEVLIGQVAARTSRIWVARAASCSSTTARSRSPRASACSKRSSPGASISGSAARLGATR